MFSQFTMFKCFWATYAVLVFSFVSEQSFFDFCISCHAGQCFDVSRVERSQLEFYRILEHDLLIQLMLT